MIKNNILGVIGGAGVAATNKFLEILENKFTTNGAFRDSHQPQMIVYQATQVPSRSMYLEGKGESFIPGYIQIANQLKNAGATRLCMICNTAHYAIDEIAKNANIEFINMVEETVKEVKKLNKMNIGLIASDGCLKGRVYEKYIDTILPNANIIYPDELMQKEVTRGIVNIKNKHRFDEIHSADRPKNIFKHVCQHLVDKKADVIILGCTDIRVDFNPEDFNKIAIIDSLEILVNKIYNFYTEKKMKNNKQSIAFYKKLARNVNNSNLDCYKFNNDATKFDIKFIKQYSSLQSNLLDLGSGTGLIVNNLIDDFKSITAIEYFEEFSKYIDNEKIEIINQDLLKLKLEKQYELITMFGVAHYFNEDESLEIYKKVYDLLKSNSIFILKNQFGLENTKIVTSSEEVGENYFAQYRQLNYEIDRLKDIGFKEIEVVDIYPKEFNRWEDTHFYALVCRRK